MIRYLFPFCLFSIVILGLIWLCVYSFMQKLYYPYIKNPICKYIKERNERLMIKISSNLRLRRNSKTQYLKLV